MRDYGKERAQCPTCLETGFMIISMPDEDVLLSCGCKFGDETHKLYQVKQYSYELHKAYRTLPLDAHWFHPQPGEDKVWCWKQMIHHAKEYWRAY